MLGGKSGSDSRTSVRGGKAAGNSLITQQTRVAGDCETTGRLRIEGHVTGDVRAASLELAASGRVDGDVLGASESSDDDRVIVEGHVEGAVRAPHVEVRREGSVSGGVFASDALVQGRVSGGIRARHRLVLEPTSVVEGDVRARRLSLQEGGVVNGTIQMGDSAAEEPAEEGRGRKASEPAPAR